VTGGDHLVLAGREWEVVFTPGHTGDHVCLFDPEARLLISGDHVLPSITPHVPGMSPLADPLGSYLESLQGLRRLGEVSLVLPAHGHPFTDLPGRIDQIVAHHEGRLLELQKIGAALGTATVVELSKELFRRAVWGMMAESETYAHLEYLRRRGKAERLEIDGQVAYRLEPPVSAPAAPPPEVTSS
jgi:glyoxylase-like metal-dependent hydrolase (beta-lactamase superfamily II)